MIKGCSKGKSLVKNQKLLKNNKNKRKMNYKSKSREQSVKTPEREGAKVGAGDVPIAPEGVLAPRSAPGAPGDPPGVSA